MQSGTLDDYEKFLSTKPHRDMAMRFVNTVTAYLLEHQNEILERQAELIAAAAATPQATQIIVASPIASVMRSSAPTTVGHRHTDWAAHAHHTQGGHFHYNP